MRCGVGTERIATINLIKLNQKLRRERGIERIATAALIRLRSWKDGKTLK